MGHTLSKKPIARSCSRPLWGSEMSCNTACSPSLPRGPPRVLLVLLALLTLPRLRLLTLPFTRSASLPELVVPLSLPLWAGSSSMQGHAPQLSLRA